jgi:hypothetical protein
MKLAGLGCIDMLGTPVRRRNDSESDGTMREYRGVGNPRIAIGPTLLLRSPAAGSGRRDFILLLEGSSQPLR